MRVDRRAENSRASQMADADNAEDNVLFGNDYEPDEANTAVVGDRR